jgi:carbon starvation protein CstA
MTQCGNQDQGLLGANIINTKPHTKGNFILPLFGNVNQMLMMLA